MAISRRDVLKIAASTPAAMAGASALLSTEALADEVAAPGVTRYNPLGSTGLKISDLSLGGGGLRSPDTVRHAIDLGINFVDTAPDYGASEATIGEAIKESSVRTKFYVQTKICRPGGYPGHANPTDKIDKVMEYVEGSLKRLQTDYIDILLIHAVGERGGTADLDRAKADVFSEAITRLKKDGKIRFSGCSSHGPGLVPNMKWAIEQPMFDTFLLSFNYLAAKGMQDFVTELKAKGKGLTVMKTLRGITEEKAVTALGKHGKNLAHSAFKWVWDKGADGLVVTMPNNKKQLRFIGASGGTLASHDVDLLDRYAAAIRSDVCHVHCGDECESACPSDVAIAETLRHDMYYTDYRDPYRATDGYAKLGARRADACATCIDTPCASACVEGVNVAGLLRTADRRLSWA